MDYLLHAHETQAYVLENLSTDDTETLKSISQRIIQCSTNGQTQCVVSQTTLSQAIILALQSQGYNIATVKGIDPTTDKFYFNLVISWGVPYDEYD